MKFTELPVLVRQKILDKVEEKTFEKYFELIKNNTVPEKMGLPFDKLQPKTQNEIHEIAKEFFEERKDRYTDMAMVFFLYNDFAIEQEKDKTIVINFDIECIVDKFMTEILATS